MPNQIDIVARIVAEASQFGIELRNAAALSKSFATEVQQSMAVASQAQQQNIAVAAQLGDKYKLNTSLMAYQIDKVREYQEALQGQIATQQQVVSSTNATNDAAAAMGKTFSAGLGLRVAGYEAGAMGAEMSGLNEMFPAAARGFRILGMGLAQNFNPYIAAAAVGILGLVKVLSVHKKAQEEMAKNLNIEVSALQADTDAINSNTSAWGANLDKKLEASLLNTGKEGSPPTAAVVQSLVDIGIGEQSAQAAIKSGLVGQLDILQQLVLTGKVRLSDTAKYIEEERLAKAGFSEAAIKESEAAMLTKAIHENDISVLSGPGVKAYKALIDAQKEWAKASEIVDVTEQFRKLGAEAGEAARRQASGFDDLASKQKISLAEQKKIIAAAYDAKNGTIDWTKAHADLNNEIQKTKETLGTIQSIQVSITAETDKIAAGYDTATGIAKTFASTLQSAIGSTGVDLNEAIFKLRQSLGNLVSDKNADQFRVDLQAVEQQLIAVTQAGKSLGLSGRELAAFWGASIGQAQTLARALGIPEEEFQKMIKDVGLLTGQTFLIKIDANTVGAKAKIAELEAQLQVLLGHFGGSSDLIAGISKQIHDLQNVDPHPQASDIFHAPLAPITDTTNQKAAAVKKDVDAIALALKTLEMQYKYGTITEQQLADQAGAFLNQVDKYSADWDEIMSILQKNAQDIQAAADAAAEAQVRLMANRFNAGDITADSYIAYLQGLLAAAQYESDTWFAIRAEIRRIQDEVAKQANDIADALKKLQDDALKQLVDAFQREFAQITDPIYAATNAVAALGRSLTLTASNIRGFYSHMQEGTSRWIADIKQLKQMGVDPSFISDLIRQGPSSLGLAEAVIGMGSEGISFINDSIKSINKMTSDFGIGETSANTVGTVNGDNVAVKIGDVTITIPTGTGGLTQEQVVDIINKAFAELVEQIKQGVNA